MRRGPYAKLAARNAHLLERIRALKADHPFWGYRRIWAYLRYVDGVIVNQKRVYNVMKVAENRDRPGPTSGGGIDITKVMIEGFGLAYLVVVLEAEHLGHATPLARARY